MDFSKLGEKLIKISFFSPRCFCLAYTSLFYATATTNSIRYVQHTTTSALAVGDLGFLKVLWAVRFFFSEPVGF